MGIEPKPISLLEECVCVYKVDFWPRHAQVSVSYLPAGSNRLYHVHITSPALWLCKPRSVNYSNAHTYTHIEALHKAMMSCVQAYMCRCWPHRLIALLSISNRWTVAIVGS